MWRRFVAQLAIVVAAALSAFVVVGMVRGDESDPRLLFVQDVPAEVRSETDAVFDRFRDRFSERASCIADVSVELVRAVDDGDARYVTGERRIQIQIPTTPGRYRESLAHELAHHLERTCSEFGSLQRSLEPLLAATGVAWSGGATWEESPSERYAEAVVELVNGERIRHVDTVPVDREALDLIARWGAGSSTRPSGTT